MERRETIEVHSVRTLGAHDHWSEYSTKELLQELVEDAQRLVKAELQLAKAELRDEARGAAKGRAITAGGAALGFGALLVLLFTLVYALALALPLWASALIVGVIAAIAAAALVWAGIKKVKRVETGPREAAGELREDRRWARETMRSAKSTRHVNA